MRLVMGDQTGSYELWMPSHTIEFNKNLTWVIYPRKNIIIMKQNSKRRGRGNAALAGSVGLTAPAGGRPSATGTGTRGKRFT